MFIFPVLLSFFLLLLKPIIILIARILIKLRFGLIFIYGRKLLSWLWNIFLRILFIEDFALLLLRFIHISYLIFACTFFLLRVWIISIFFHLLKNFVFFFTTTFVVFHLFIFCAMNFINLKFVLYLHGFNNIPKILLNCRLITL